MTKFRSNVGCGCCYSLCSCRAIGALVVGSRSLGDDDAWLENVDAGEAVDKGAHKAKGDWEEWQRTRENQSREADGKGRWLGPQWLTSCGTMWRRW